MEMRDKLNRLLVDETEKKKQDLDLTLYS